MSASSAPAPLAQLPLGSPGRLTSARHRLELAIEREMTHSLGQFLSWVGDRALIQGPSFNAGEVRAGWAFTVNEVAGHLFTALPGLDLDYRRAVLQRMDRLALPDLAYDSAHAVLLDSSAGRAVTRAKQMRVAMSLDTGVTSLVAGLEVVGRAWRSLAQFYARMEVTAGFSYEVIRQAIQRDVPRLVWVAHHDERTRPTHLAADGYAARPGGQYRVGNSLLAYPGDPSGPLEETANCRCVLSSVTARRSGS